MAPRHLGSWAVAIARQIIVDILGDSSGFNKAVDSASGKAGGFKNVLSGIGVGIGAAAFNVLDTAVSGIIGTLGDADQAFKDDQASQDLLATALRNNIPGWNGNTDAIEANITAQQKKGVNDGEQRQGMVELLNKTHDITAATSLSNAAIELAAGTGKTYSEAISEIVSGLNGRAAALGKDGIAIQKNGTAADLAATIMDKYKGSQDALAETSEGKTKISQEKVGEAMEKLGGIVDRVSSVALPILADAFSNIIDIVSNVIDTIQPVIDTVMPALSQAVTIVGGVFNTVFPVVQTLVGTVFGAIGTVIADFMTALGTAGDVVRTVTDTMGGLFNGLSQIVGTVFNGIGSAIRGALNTVIDIIDGAIGSINSISFRIDNPLGGDPLLNFTGLNLPLIPRLHSGGIVPGIRGTEVPILAIAGEQVTPLGAPTASGSVVTVAAGAIVIQGGGQSPQQIARETLLELRRELTRQGLSLA